MTVESVRRRRAWPHPVVVAADLDDLRGPTSGVVELPHRMFWQPDRHVNLDNPALLRWMYETVLRESVSLEELATWLDGPTLLQVWPELYLPPWVKRAWMAAHPDLVRQAA